MPPSRFPEPPAGSGGLRLMTIRSEGQFNTVVYEEEDIYRGQERQQRDLDECGRHTPAWPGNRPAGLRAKLSRRHARRASAPFDIKAGNAAMYFPEANILVPGTTDPDSKTPAFKSVPITLEPERAYAPTGQNGIQETGAGVAVSLDVARS